MYIKLGHLNIKIHKKMIICQYRYLYIMSDKVWCGLCKEAKSLYLDFPVRAREDGPDIGDICKFCVKKRSEEVKRSQVKHRFECECGTTLRSDTDRAISKHLATDLHKNNLTRKRPIKGVVYNCKQLERLCKVNKVYYYSKMKSTEMIDALLEIDRDANDMLKIPEDI